jgi:hypothetical protein
LVGQGLVLKNGATILDGWTGYMVDRVSTTKTTSNASLANPQLALRNCKRSSSYSWALAFVETLSWNWSNIEWMKTIYGWWSKYNQDHFKCMQVESEFVSLANPWLAHSRKLVLFGHSRPSFDRWYL